MTADAARYSPTPPPVPTAHGGGSDARTCGLLLLILGGLYGLLYTPNWIPGGSDDAFYLSVARNMAQGQGFQWHGAPVLISPPGWPWLLSVVMRVTDSFAVLNLLPWGLMLGAAGLWYFVVRRFAPPRLSFWVVLLSATTFQWVRCGMHHYSEASFCFLTAAGLLLAMQVGEGRGVWWRFPLLLAACAAAVQVRWPGVFLFAIVTPALMARRNEAERMRGGWLLGFAAALVPLAAAVVAALAGRWEAARAAGKIAPTASYALVLALLAVGSLVPVAMGLLLRRRVAGTAYWRITGVALCGLVIVGTYGLTRKYVHEFASTRGAAAVEAIERDERREVRMLTGGTQKFVGRVINAGGWPAAVFWPQTEMVRLDPAADVVESVLGWVLVAFFTWRLVLAWRRGEWAWAGAVLYCGAIVILWTRPTGRYIVPLAPLLLLGVWQGMQDLAQRVGHGRFPPRLARAALALVLGSVVAANAPMHLMSAAVVRSPWFHEAWLGGEFASAEDVAEYLRARGVRDGEIATNVGCVAVQLTRNNRFTIRILNWLSDVQIVTLKGLGPKEWRVQKATGKRVLRPPLAFNTRPNELLVAEAKKTGIRYYVFRPCDQPKTFWHFRSSWLRATFLRKKVEPDPPYLELWELKGERFERVALPGTSRAIARVPRLATH